MIRLFLCVAVCALLPSSTVLAAENVTYTYDAQGRLIDASRSGTVNNGVNTSIVQDKVDNRTAYSVTGPNGSPGVVVLPLPGFPVIPVGLNQ